MHLLSQAQCGGGSDDTSGRARRSNPWGAGFDKRKEGTITLYYGVCVTRVSSDTRKNNYRWHFVDPVPARGPSSGESSPARFVGAAQWRKPRRNPVSTFWRLISN